MEKQECEEKSMQIAKKVVRIIYDETDRMGDTVRYRSAILASVMGGYVVSLAQKNFKTHSEMVDFVSFMFDEFKNDAIKTIKLDEIH